MSRRGSSERDMDPFTMVFDSFQASLSRKNDQSDKAALLEEKVSMFMRKDLQNAATARLKRIQKMRRLTLTRLATKIHQNRVKMDAIESSHFQALTTAVRHRNATERRLMQQVLGADRRMRELIFEILGEYGKSDVRVKRRQEYIHFTARLKLVARISFLRWQRFVLYLCDLLSSAGQHSNNHEPSSQTTATTAAGAGNEEPLVTVTGKVLSPETDMLEWIRVRNAVDHHLHQLRSPVMITSIVKITKTQRVRRPLPNKEGKSSLPLPLVPTIPTPMMRPGSRGGVTSPPITFQGVITRPSEFATSLGRLHAWIAKDMKKESVGHTIATNSVNESNSSNGNKLMSNGVTSRANANIPSQTLSFRPISNDMLSIAPIQWLHPPSYFPNIWESIYRDSLAAITGTVTPFVLSFIYPPYD